MSRKWAAAYACSAVERVMDDPLARLSLSRVLPDRYPPGDDVETYVPLEHGFAHLLDIGVIMPRLGHLYPWSSDELALPGLRALVDGETPTYAWDAADAGIWCFEPSLLARAARRMVPAG